MSPEATLPENHEKILTGQTMLFAEPLFVNPAQDSTRTIFDVPQGAEHFALAIGQMQLDELGVAISLGSEYVDIVTTLKKNDVHFSPIIAHPGLMGFESTRAILESIGTKGFPIHPSVRTTAFPRDMMVDFDGEYFVNPRSNLTPATNRIRLSTLGEGGRVLKLGDKVFIPHPDTYDANQPDSMEDIKQLEKRFRVAPLPHITASRVNTKTGEITNHPSPHLDRGAAFIKGADKKDYLLVDSTYLAGRHPSIGNNADVIKNACDALDVTLVDVPRTQESIPYALNLVQFADNSLVMTGGDEVARKIVGEIVGQTNVVTTERPILFYPLLRYGGIRCMTLVASSEIIESLRMTNPTSNP